MGDADHFPLWKSSPCLVVVWAWIAAYGRLFFAADYDVHDISPTLAAAPQDVVRFAGVAELVDALGLGSSDESCGGSSPSARTKRTFLSLRIQPEDARVRRLNRRRSFRRAFNE